MADRGNIEETVEDRESREASGACAPQPSHKRGADQHAAEPDEEEEDAAAEPRCPNKSNAEGRATDVGFQGVSGGKIRASRSARLRRKKLSAAGISDEDRFGDSATTSARDRVPMARGRPCGDGGEQEREAQGEGPAGGGAAQGDEAREDEAAFGALSKDEGGEGQAHAGECMPVG